jgi:hypothetical protein
MTIKEIAELCGVDERTVQRWIESLKNVKSGQNVVSLQILDKLGQGKAADLSLETVVAIIRDGGKNKTLAALLEENAANKNALVIRDNPPSAIDPFPELSTAKLHEWRMYIKQLQGLLEAKAISVREFRRLAYNLDTPDAPDNPIKGSLTFKSHDDFKEYAETYKKANPTVYSFAKTVLKITGNPGNFVLVRDLYRLYREYTNTWEAVTRQNFVRRIKEIYPGLEYKQKKVNGRPELVFMGCVLGVEGLEAENE